MKTVNFIFTLLLAVMVATSCSKDEMSTSNPTQDFSPESLKKESDFTKQGNNAPNGKHYNLNIIGVSKGKNPDMTNSNGHVIFVPMEGKVKIELEKGDFAVLDANGTDADGAQFRLPDPGLDPYVVGEEGTADTETDYSVFVRPLGKPGGWSTMTTVADVVESSLTEFLSAKEIKVLNAAAEHDGVASVEQVGTDITFREKGKSTFTNVTAELLTIVLKVEATYEENGEEITEIIYVRVPLFDDLIENEYWEYDNNGLRILQVRFYPGVVSDVTDWD